MLLAPFLCCVGLTADLHLAGLCISWHIHRQSRFITEYSLTRVLWCTWRPQYLQVHTHTHTHTHTPSKHYHYPHPLHPGLATTTVTSPIWVVKTQIQLDTRSVGLRIKRSLGSQAFPVHVIVRVLIVRGRETFEIGEGLG